MLRKKQKLINKFYKWIWYKLGWLNKTDKVIDILSWNRCRYDDKWGQRKKVTFIMPFSKEAKRFKRNERSTKKNNKRI